MSILYDYLSVLEKKKSVEDPRLSSTQPVVPVPASAAPIVSPSTAARAEKKTPVVSPKFAPGLLVLIAAGVLFFAVDDLKNSIAGRAAKPKTGEEKSKAEEGAFPVAAVRSGFDYSLNGIIYNANSPSAVIDGKIVVKGVMLGDWQVVDISPSDVKLENLKNGSVLTLKLESVVTP